MRPSQSLALLPTVCLGSALAFHGFTPPEPITFDFALPRGIRPSSRLLHEPLIWHQFPAETFFLGRSAVRVVDADGASVGVYSPARSVVDSLRVRGAVPEDVALSALAQWLADGGRGADLMAIADRIPRASKPVAAALALMDRS